MVLSILIPTVPRRLRSFYPDIIEGLLSQIQENPEVEVLGLFDNKRRTVGDKRNALLGIANGEFLTFIDDDDRVAIDYVQTVLLAIKEHSDADVICFDCITTKNGDTQNQVYSKYSKTFEYLQGQAKADGYIQWRGKPAHTMVWRSSIAKKHHFPGKNYAEDVDWVVKATADIEKEIQLNKVLYFYNFNQSTTETR